MTALREGLLRDRTVAVAAGVPEAVRDALVALGAQVVGSEDPDPAHALVFDAGARFADGGAAGLGAALEHAWAAIRAVAACALIPRRSGGKVVLVGPRPDAGPFAGAARDALENLARTLSIEWARYGVTTTMIAPGERTTDDQLAQLVCFLLSPAGDYFSGCRLSLGLAWRSSAHGTTTPPSCGESRPTTCSAGSVSETLSSTRVSCGGT